MSSSYLYALLGGGLIGLSSAGMLWSHGKILGVSGIIGGIFKAKGSNFYWRFMFLIGIAFGAFLIEPIGFSVMSYNIDRSLPFIALGGLFVGFGTTIGNGCTSGHGVCGISRFSPRSIVATMIFISSGILSVAVIDHLLGGIL